MYGNLVPEELIGKSEEGVLTESPSAASRLAKYRQFYPHFRDVEIEAKLNLDFSRENIRQVIRNIADHLERHGVTLIDKEITIRDNYSIYYKRTDKLGGKIIARNLGNSGFQVKLKTKREQESVDNIVVRDEVESKIFPSLESAEHFLGQTLNITQPRSSIESVIRIKKCKLIIKVVGSDSVYRFFDLIIDESKVVACEDAYTESGKMARQIEVEYIGSNSIELDSLELVRESLKYIVALILQNSNFHISKTTLSKREWSRS